jgi:hypothetical protein
MLTSLVCDPDRRTWASDADNGRRNGVLSIPETRLNALRYKSVKHELAVNSQPACRWLPGPAGLFSLQQRAKVPRTLISRSTRGPPEYSRVQGR